MRQGAPTDEESENLVELERCANTVRTASAWSNTKCTSSMTNAGAGPTQAGDATRRGESVRLLPIALEIAVCQQLGCRARGVAAAAAGPWLRCMLRSSLAVADRRASHTEGCSACAKISCAVLSFRDSNLGVRGQPDGLLRYHIMQLLSSDAPRIWASHAPFKTHMQLHIGT